MLDLFGKKYTACSNLFIYTLEGDRYTYPAPLSIEGTLENADKNTHNQLEIRFSSYLDSPMVIPSVFRMTAFLLTPYYIIEVISIDSLLKKEDIIDTYGYKASFSFQDGSLSMNILDGDIYDPYSRFIKQRETNDK